MSPDVFDHFDLESIFVRAAADAGVALSETPRELALYTTRRAQHLSTITHEPGFDVALAAERDSIAIRAGIAIDNVATLGDRWFLGVVQGALGLLVQVIVAA